MQLSNKFQTTFPRAVLASFVILLVNLPADVLAKKTAASSESNPLQVLSQDAYIWGYPAVLMKQVREAMLAKSPQPEKALNHFFHSQSLPETFFKNLFTTNSENLYSWAWLDLEKEPLLLTQPAIANRYFSVQFVDAYSNVFHVISNDNWDDKSAVFAITSPSWKGELPAGVVRLRATTNEVFVLAQTSLQETKRSTTDISTVRKLNQQWQFVALSSWKQGLRKELTQEVTPKEAFAINTNLALLGLHYFEELAAVVKKNPPPTSADTLQWQKFSKVLSKPQWADRSPRDPSPKVLIERGFFAGARNLEDRIARGFGPKVNGWSYDLKTEPFREDYLTRAAVAQTSLFSTPSKEMVQLKAVSDSEDRQLYGNYKYNMHFNKGELPPTSTHWTLRILENNGKAITSAVETARLSDRSGSLKYNADGSVDVHLQTEAPEKSAQTNWLPLRDQAGFSVVLTIYNPHNAVLNRKYVAPSITRIEEEGLPRPKIVRTMMAQHPFAMSQNETKQ